LLKTPFVSLYGSMSWAEDFADFTALYWLTEKLKQPYEIKYFEDGEMKMMFRPMAGREKEERKKLMERYFGGEKRD